MMRCKQLVYVLCLQAICGLASAAKVGSAAPDFSATDSQGATQKLTQYKGKYVVLEWHNAGCPYVKKHYDSDNMQKLQRAWTAKGVAWLTVISSAPGKEGFADASGARADVALHKAAPTATLLDPTGALGKMYGAKTTPHMFIIDPQGKLIYNGAIDDKPDADSASISGAKNYVSQALQEAMAGRPVSEASTTPYGCGVKY